MAPPDNRRKVRAIDGVVGLVCKDLGNGSISIEMIDGYYKFYYETELEDITDEDFKKHFR